MKPKIYLYFVLLLPMCFLLSSPLAAAQKIYIDPVNGDDRNSGLSPEDAKKNDPNGNDSFSNSSGQTYRAKSPTLSQEEAPQWKSQEETPQWERIILGTEIITGWEAFTRTIWASPAEFDFDNYGFRGVWVGGENYPPGCFADFLEPGQCAYNDKSVIINDPDGNPNETGKDISLWLVDLQSGERVGQEMDGLDWTAAPPSAWKKELMIDPIHVFVDDEYLSYPDGWWGQRFTLYVTCGEDGFLYLRNLDGNPDAIGKKVEAVTRSGGWSVASGDFNGDGLVDMVHSSSGNKLGYQVFVNYGASEFAATPAQILTSPEDLSEFGFFVTSAGDVNHDGYDDLLVTTGWPDDIVLIYNGSSTGLSSVPSHRLAAPNGIQSLWQTVAGDGSINGDEYADILIIGGDGSYTYLLVYLGGEEGIGSSPDAVIPLPENMRVEDVSIAGDINQDGFDDTVLSMVERPDSKHIRLLVFNGRADGNLTDPYPLEFSVAEPETDSYIDAVVRPAGDINGDGFPDLLVGNEYAQGDYENEGKVYVFLGSADGLLQGPAVTIDNPLPEENTRFGTSLTGIGDWNYDGFDDIAVGCPYHESNRGFVAVYPGGADGIAASPSQIIYGVRNFSYDINYFGWSLARGGDIKGNDQTFFIAGEEFGSAYLYGQPRPDPGCGGPSPGCGTGAGIKP